MSTPIHKNTFTIQVCSNVCPHVKREDIKPQLAHIFKKQQVSQVTTNSIRLAQQQTRLSSKISKSDTDEMIIFQNIWNCSLKTDRKDDQLFDFSSRSDFVDTTIEEVIFHKGRCILKPLDVKR